MTISCPTQVDSFPYQWLIVKNKTIIGPKSTEEQKVLFIPPQAGVYQAVLSVSSWPASAEAQAVARAEVFAKRVVLVAMAENPALEVRGVWLISCWLESQVRSPKINYCRSLVSFESMSGQEGHLLRGHTSCLVCFTSYISVF